MVFTAAPKIRVAYTKNSNGNTNRHFSHFATYFVHQLLTEGMGSPVTAGQSGGIQRGILETESTKVPKEQASEPYVCTEKTRGGTEYAQE